MPTHVKGKQILDQTITQSKLNLTTPSSNNDAATKIYVDTAVSGVSHVALSGLTDVSLNSLTNAQMLVYSATTQKWVNTNTIDSTTLFYTKAEIDALLTAYPSSATTVTTGTNQTITGIKTFSNGLYVSGITIDSVLFKPYQYVTTGTTQTISGVKTFSSSVLMLNGLYVSGTTTYVNTQNLNIKDNLILINSGETGSGVTLQYAGIEVDRGSSPKYGFYFDENGDYFRVGMTGQTQAVATRDDNPTNGYIATWDAATFKFVTTLNSATLATTSYVGTNFYTKTQADANFLSANTSVSAALSGLTDVTITSPINGQVLTYNGSIWINSAVTSTGDLSNYYTKTQTDANFLSANTSVSAALSGLTDVSIANLIDNQVLAYSATTDKWYNADTFDIMTLLYLSGLTDVTINNPISGHVLTFNGTVWINSAVTSTGDLSNYYTKTQVNQNFLSANTSFYTQTQANANFLSANTSFFTQAQSIANFLSANTSFYTQAQANANFLSANTSYYTQAQANANFLSANTSGNWLSANTSYYTQTQVNANFLSANTSYYTQTQSNANFLSANTALVANTTISTATFNSGIVGIDITSTSYSFVEYKYILSSGTTNNRAGHLIINSNGTLTNSQEITTADIGTTSGVTFSTGISGTNIVLSATTSTNGWTFKYTKYVM